MFLLNTINITSSRKKIIFLCLTSNIIEISHLPNNQHKTYFYSLFDFPIPLTLTFEEKDRNIPRRSNYFYLRIINKTFGLAPKFSI